MLFDENKRHITLHDLTFGDNVSVRIQSSDREAEQMMENFDDMCEIIKNRVR